MPATALGKWPCVLNSDSDCGVELGSSLEQVTIPLFLMEREKEPRSNMWKLRNMVSAAFAIAVLASCWLAFQAATAQTKANVPKPQNTRLLGEGAVQQLLLLMEPDKNGKISRQAWMTFMAEEFDRLDKDKKGELDAEELRRSNAVVYSRPRDVGK